jgi:uncharacterized membrane protein
MRAVSNQKRQPVLCVLISIFTLHLRRERLYWHRCGVVVICIVRFDKRFPSRVDE